MPKLLEVQMVNWGPLRPDPIPLFANGVNVATGPNGSGKTCFLDGVKLLLGVDHLGAGRTASGYVFDGGPNGGPADRAYLRATFANPVGPDGRHRVFAWAGYGCEDSPHVSVVCVVSGSGRWYVVLPGRIVWGAANSPLMEGLSEIDALPHSRRRGPRQYDELLDRTGVTRALRSVLALPQGATDQIVQRSPTGMLRSLLELTGKQTTLDEFKAQREQYEAAREAYSRTLERFRAEETNLRLLQTHARQHREWVDLEDRLRRAQEVLAPAAHFRDLDEQARELTEEVEQRQRAVAEDEATLERLHLELPELEASHEEAEKRASIVERQRDRLTEIARTLRQQIGVGDENLRHLTDDRDRAAALAEGVDVEDANRIVEQRRVNVREATSSFDRLNETRISLTAEIAALREGRSVPPADVAELLRLLDEVGITCDVVADSVELDGHGEVHARMAEAALGDAIWAVVVAASDHEQAVRLAVKARLRVPVGVAGEGLPELALAGLDYPDQLGKLLHHLDVEAVVQPNGIDAVTADGVRWSPALARLSAPPTPVLGRLSRERRLFAAEGELTELGGRILSAEAELAQAEDALEEARAVSDAIQRLPVIVNALEERAKSLAALEREAAETEDSFSEADRQLRALERKVTEVGARIAALKEQRGIVTDRLGATRRPQLAQATDRLNRSKAELGRLVLTDEQKLALEAGEVPPSEVVDQQVAELASAVGDEERFPADIRDSLILVQVDGQREVVERVDLLVSGRKEDLDSQQQLVDEARRRYDEHVRAVVRLLNAEFERVCSAAGVEGELRMIPGEHPNEYGVDVRVAHRPGEPRRSYRDPGHSGGQRAKIAILILLAAMGVGGSADLLIMDEHIAHLDSTNIDHMAQLMQSLKERVQFLLATPTNAESLRLGWCDLQLAFLPRNPGDAYTPSLRIMTRLSADDLDERFADDQLTLT